MSLLGCWVNRYYAMHRIYNGARTRLLLFLPYSARVLPYSARVLPYSARVGLYGVGGMRWERVVVCKVSRGGPVTKPLYRMSQNKLQVLQKYLNKILSKGFIRA